jgi:hypothetical protein
MGENMKTFLTAALLLGLNAAAAQAETFTFTGTFKIDNQLATPVATGKSVALFAENSSTMTYASGKKALANGNCTGWSALPGSGSALTGMCLFSESATDKGSISMSCNWTDAQQTQADCWGQITGVSGRWRGKTGTIGWHQVLGPDGKNGTTAGAGMWNS